MKRAPGGFTLIEMIVVIAIVGILAGMVALFVRSPLQASFDAARRAELTDTADTALRRMARDIQGALSNSVRVDATGSFLEFIPIRAAGRYRAEVDATGAGNPLDFSSNSDGSFDVLGPGVDIASGDSIVIYNLGVPGSDVYEGSSRRAASATGSGLSSVSFDPAGVQFPFASPSSRFQVVSTPVTYACDVASGKLWRYSGYAIQAAQPASIAALDALAGVTKAQLASKVSACSFVYAAGVTQRNGLVSIRLSLADGGETATLMHQVNVTSTP